MEPVSFLAPDMIIQCATNSPSLKLDFTENVMVLSLSLLQYDYSSTYGRHMYFSMQFAALFPGRDEKIDQKKK